MKPFSFALLMLAGSMIVACSGDQHEDAPHPTVTLSANPTTLARGESTRITVEVTNFTLSEHHEDDHHGDAHDDHGDGDDVPREGHYHVYLDSTDEHPLVMGIEPEADVVIDAEPGEHELIVRLHDLDHKIIHPEVTDSVTITVLEP